MTDLALSGIARRSRSLSHRTAAPGALAAEVLPGLENYRSLAADWQRLAELQKHTILFQMPAVLETWARHFADSGGSLATIVVRDEERPVLVWPLFIERRTLVTVATGAGCPIGQYDDILIDPAYDGEASIATAIAALKETARPDLLFLERVRADGALKAALKDASPLAWPEGAPFADLPGGTAGLMKSLKPRVVRQQKKRMRRFCEAGSVSFDIADDPGTAQEWLAEAMRLKRDWLKSTGRVSRAFLKPETADCLNELARTISDPEAPLRMVVSRLALDGRTAAIEMGFRHRDTYHLYLGAFEPELAKLGPGNVLTEKVLDWCSANGVSRYDMLAPRSRNKAEWQSGEVAVLDFALPLTAIGKLYAATMLERLGPAMRDTFYALPAPLRSAIAGLTLRI